MKNAQDFKDVACAVAAGALANPTFRHISVCVTGNDDIRTAIRIRSLSKAVYEQIAEEMDLLDAVKAP